MTNHNRAEYVALVLKERLFDRVRPQLQALLRGFHDLLPPALLTVFSHGELELMLCGLPSINVGDWKANTQYLLTADNGERWAVAYTSAEPVVAWFWEMVRRWPGLSSPALARP